MGLQERGLACQPLVQHKEDEQSLVHELLEMAACPESFSKSELSLMLLVAATAIIKLEQFDRQTESRHSDVRNRD